MDITIIYGTETGNSEGLAKDAQKTLSSLGHNVKVLDMEGVTLDQLAPAGVVLVVTSTWGDGEPPSNAERLHEELKTSSADFSAVRYAVYALGMESFDQFCQTGKDFDEYFARLGAHRLAEIYLSDDDFDSTFPGWVDKIATALS